MTLQSTITRATFKKYDDIRDAGLTTPEDVQRFDNIVYGTAAPKMQVLDVYRPKHISGKLPVIVSVHGGGWVYGDKERYQYYCMSLAQRGFAVVNFTYRLAPEHLFPAHLEDTTAAFCWTVAHAEEYGFDTERVFGVGDSAGAHLLGLFCCLCVNPSYAAQYSFAPPQGFVPRGVALNCGHYTYDFSKPGDISPLMQELLGTKPTQENMQPLDVIANLAPGFPPAFVMTCTGDFLAPQAQPLCDALTAQGVPNALHFYESATGKDLGHVFHCNMRSSDAARCNDEECAWFKTL